MEAKVEKPHGGAFSPLASPPFGDRYAAYPYRGRMLFRYSRFIAHTLRPSPP